MSQQFNTISHQTGTYKHKLDSFRIKLNVSKIKSKEHVTETDPLFLLLLKMYMSNKRGSGKFIIPLP